VGASHVRIDDINVVLEAQLRKWCPELNQAQVKRLLLEVKREMVERYLREYRGL
jgi:hypothetical protein